MKRVIVMFFVFLFIYGGLCWGARNPFVDLFPKKVEHKERSKEYVGEETKLEELANLNIEGVFWGTDMPEAIINGEVYKENEKIKDIDAEIVKIEKDSVTIFYKGRSFILSVKQKLKGGRL